MALRLRRSPWPPAWSPPPPRRPGHTPPACDDATFLRRASLDLVGRQPSPAEIEAFLADPSPGKRTDLVDRLLADPAWATNWARYFRDVILYRRSDERAIVMAASLEAFFAGHLEAMPPGTRSPAT